MNTEIECVHDWIRFKGNNHISCFICKLFPYIDRRYQCNKCFKEICFLCIQKEFNIETELVGRTLEKLEENKEFYKEKIDKHELAIELINQRLQQLEYRINLITNDKAESSRMAQQLEEKHEIISINNNSLIKLAISY